MARGPTQQLDHRVAALVGDNGDSEGLHETNGGYKIVVRVRPPTAAAEEDPEVVKALSCTRLRVHRIDQEPLELQVDNVLGCDAGQGDTFRAVQSVVSGVADGVNGTILAYGQTGSGKTYTMTGEAATVDSADHPAVRRALQDSQRGLIPRALDHLFKRLGTSAAKSSYRVYVSFMEIYAERVFDLLVGPRPKGCDTDAFSIRANSGGQGLSSSAAKSSSRRALAGGLEVLEGRGGSVSVPNLTVVEVRSLDQALEVLRIGTASRTSGDNGVNASSSRSHSIFQVLLERRPPGSRSAPHVSKLNLVDLAGSEKLRPDSGLGGTALQELTCINLSLSALGQCIAALVDQKRTHVPYRDSKLTRLLQDALRGRSLTAMCVCISPSMSSLEETLSSLKFADRAKRAVLDRSFMSPAAGSASPGDSSSAAALRRMEELQSKVQDLTAELEEERKARRHLESILESQVHTPRRRRSSDAGILARPVVGALDLPIPARQVSHRRRRRRNEEDEHAFRQRLLLRLSRDLAGDELGSLESVSSSPSSSEGDLDASFLGRMKSYAGRKPSVKACLERLARQNEELMARIDALEGRSVSTASTPSIGGIPQKRASSSCSSSGAGTAPGRSRLLAALQQLRAAEVGEDDIDKGAERDADADCHEVVRDGLDDDAARDVDTDDDNEHGQDSLPAEEDDGDDEDDNDSEHTAPKEDPDPMELPKQLSRELNSSSTLLSPRSRRRPAREESGSEGAAAVEGTWTPQLNSPVAEKVPAALQTPPQPLRRQPGTCEADVLADSLETNRPQGPWEPTNSPIPSFGALSCGEDALSPCAADEPVLFSKEKPCGTESGSGLHDEVRRNSAVRRSAAPGAHAAAASRASPERSPRKRGGEVSDGRPSTSNLSGRGSPRGERPHPRKELLKKAREDSARVRAEQRAREPQTFSRQGKAGDGQEAVEPSKVQSLAEARKLMTVKQASSEAPAFSPRDIAAQCWLDFEDSLRS